jgi:hypothetical protein
VALWAIAYSDRAAVLPAAWLVTQGCACSSAAPGAGLRINHSAWSLSLIARGMAWARCRSGWAVNVRSAGQ